MVKKSYMFNISKSRVQRDGGRNQEAKIYRITKNKPIYVTSTKWNTASYKGADSEVYTKLIKEKEIKADKDEPSYYRNRSSKTDIYELR